MPLLSLTTRVDLPLTLTFDVHFVMPIYLTILSQKVIMRNLGGSTFCKNADRIVELCGLLKVTFYLNLIAEARLQQSFLL